ncbi:LuxR C-terminal-related transcriptional regulator [Micromonospora sp. NPDC049044]|uniref:LuxR C-terminal-related transcriptional regulator n=1 Tax=unclassified Micromonospora TaxID=2617518 RepID=UPI0033E4BD0C
MTESVYLALLGNPGAKLDAVALEMQLPEERVRNAFDELVQMSLVYEPPQDGGRFRVVNPATGIAALVARRQREMEESRAALELLVASRTVDRTPTVEPGVERLEGIEAIRAKISELAESCVWENASLMPGGAQSQESLLASQQLDAVAIDRGVRVRTVYLDSVRNDPHTLKYASWLSDLGSEVRTAPTLPLRLLIVDRRVAVVPAQTEDSRAAAVVVTSEGVVAGLAALFQSVWRTATPLGSPRRRDDEGLSAQDRDVLKLLGQGLTDEMIARRMGVSVRTARRIASDLLTRLDARSRFQAGAKAVVREWLTADDLE